MWFPTLRLAACRNYGKVKDLQAWSQRLGAAKDVLFVSQGSGILTDEVARRTWILLLGLVGWADA